MFRVIRSLSAKNFINETGTEEKMGMILHENCVPWKIEKDLLKRAIGYNCIAAAQSQAIYIDWFS